MNKIFKYELRRIVSSKIIWAIASICLFYGWKILTTDTILGTAHTAPFSPWSFGSYLAQMTPLLGAALFLLLWNQFSGKGRKFSILTDTTPVNKRNFILVKCCAVITVWLLLALLVVLFGMGFLIYLFQSAVSIAALLKAVLLVLGPALLFLTGMGMLVLCMIPEHKNSTAILQKSIILAAAALAILTLLPFSYNLHGSSFFSEYPLKINKLNPAFQLPIQVLISKLIYSFAGLTALVAAVFYKSRSIFARAKLI